MKDELDCIAFHEAGHAVAHILAGVPFKYVTIKEEKVKDELGKRSLGHIAYEKPKTKRNGTNIPSWIRLSSVSSLRTISRN